MIEVIAAALAVIVQLGFWLSLLLIFGAALGTIVYLMLD